MRIGSFTGAVVAGLGIVLTAVSSGATNPNPPPRLLAPAQLANHQLVPRSARRRPSYVVSLEGCTSDSSMAHYFVGFTSAGFAGGGDSAVAGGAGNEACGNYSAIGSGQSNVISSEENGLDSLDSMIGSGYYNAVTSPYAFVGSGSYNEASGMFSFMGAGAYNFAGGPGSFVGAGGDEYASHNLTPGGNNVANGADSFVGAGDLNLISGAGSGSFIGGGGYAYAAASGAAPSVNNQISGVDSFIGAGDNNDVGGNEAAIAGGQSNSIGAAGSEAAVGGGKNNNATGLESTIGGGSYNSATGTHATVPGGYDNAAEAQDSFAAGYGAKARNAGAFVWSDDASTSPVQSTKNDQFIARASGGYILYSDTSGDGANLPGGSGTWGSMSDRTRKTNIVPLDDAAVLDKVAALPVTEWSYKAERGVRHVGPMAQDFYAAFGVGEDNRHITSIDEDGVALAAIKALHSADASLHTENARLRERVAQDEALLGRDDSRLAALEEKVNNLAQARAVR